MDADTREVARDQKLVQFNRSCDGLDEDDNLQALQHRLFCNELKTANLVEFEGIEKLIELPVFADLVKLDVVLLKTVKRELRLVVDKDLERLRSRSIPAHVKPNLTYVGHELLARNTDILGQCCREHHDLLVVRGDPEYFLNVPAHVCMDRTVG